MNSLTLSEIVYSPCWMIYFFAGNPRERQLKKADFPVFFPTKPIPARSATSSASQLPATFD
jgi:hypothetical protein